MKKALIVTLGCRLNHADTSLLTARLIGQGYEMTDDLQDKIDLIVVNSCAVTAEAVTKSRHQVRRLRREHPQAKIIVTGCAVELEKERLLASGADFALTNPDKRHTPQEATGILSCQLSAANFKEQVISEFPFRTRAFIKIQEGCDNRCAYCIVPTVRGPARSRDFEEALADCRHAVEAGFPEIILTGVNTCAYCDQGKTLADFVKAVARLEGNFRIRLSSTEPHPSDLTIPEMIADPANRLCRFLHLSMQHGCSRILRRMNRHYDAEEFAEFVAKAKDLVPDIHIGTDIIVGFPGETDKDFEESLANIRRIGFANIHQFAYSIRPGTPAAEMPGQVPPQAVAERMAELRKIAEVSAREFALSQCGKTLPVIFERKQHGVVRGWSDNYLEVTLADPEMVCGKIVPVPATPKNLGKFRCDAFIRW